MVQPDGPYRIIRHISITCWITKATDTHKEYIILMGFPTATMVTPACLNVTLYVQLLVSLAILSSCLSRNHACGQSAIREDVPNFEKVSDVNSDLEQERRSDWLMLKNKEHENHLVLKSEGLVK